MGYSDTRGAAGRPAGLALTGAIHVGIIAAILAIPAERLEPIIETVLATHNIPDDPVVTPPPPDPAQPSAPSSQPAVTKQIVETLSESTFVLPRVETFPTTDLGDRFVLPTVDPPITPPRDPVWVGAQVDPRFARDFQPDYPSGKLRAEIEAVVTVRVLIGADGRVKAVEPVGNPDRAFFEATRRQALSSWRFIPATRDGAPAERWQEMTVRFEIH